ncbi:MAG TPA: hypothetical protein VMD75_12030 [Candidatus Binataceae bacterium]|nr:hypothetical protein [Candidatus Binataceae bacterium]
MQRLNPGPFEPLVYVIQSPGFFRAIGLGGFALFTIFSLAIAATHGFIYFAVGLILFLANWYDLSISICRRCRFYGTWHCLGQGMLVSRIFPRLDPPIADFRVLLHFALTTLFLLYGLFWLWHSVGLGILFTIWLPIAALSAMHPGGFSWRLRPRLS